MNFKLLLALVAALSVTALRAEDEESESAEENAAAESAEASEDGEQPAIEGLPVVKKRPEKIFTTLPVCVKVAGKAEVRKPLSGQWEPALEGKFYPLGSSYRTQKDGEITVAFGRKCTVSSEGEAVFGTRPQGLGGETRTLVLESGSVRVSFPENLKPGLFSVAAPGFTVRNPAGDSSYAYRSTGDGDEAVIRCITGTVSIEGRHFTVPTMRVSNQFRIRSSHDNLESILYGEAGDFVVRLDSGLVMKTKIDENGNVEHPEEESYLDWHLSPETRVQINRAVPAIGERMSVSVMTFDSKGELKNHFAFAERRSNVNSGELAKSAQDAKQAEIAKRAAEATSETAANDEGASEANNESENNESNESEQEEE